MTALSSIKGAVKISRYPSVYICKVISKKGDTEKSTDTRTSSLDPSQEKMQWHKYRNGFCNIGSNTTPLCKDPSQPSPHPSVWRLILNQTNNTFHLLRGDPEAIPAVPSRRLNQWCKQPQLTSNHRLTSLDTCLYITEWQSKGAFYHLSTDKSCDMWPNTSPCCMFHNSTITLPQHNAVSAVPTYSQLCLPFTLSQWGNSNTDYWQWLP